MHRIAHRISPFIVLFVLIVGGVANTALAQETAGAVRVEGVAALIAGEGTRVPPVVILLSDVELRARLRLAGQREGIDASVPLPASLLRAVLDEMIGEALLAREAERTQVAEPTAAALEAERRRLWALGGGRARTQTLLGQLGADEDELSRMAERRAQAAVFLESNLQNGRVMDAEIERVYASGEHPFLGQDLEEVREAMRVWLLRGRVASQVAQWVATLRERVHVVVRAPYAAD